MTGIPLSYPRRFFRSCSAVEIGRPDHRTSSPKRSGPMADTTARVSELNLTRTYFDLVAATRRPSPGRTPRRGNPPHLARRQVFHSTPRPAVAVRPAQRVHGRASSAL
ncbi:hypothetical protein [Streptomyces mirabilis]